MLAVRSPPGTPKHSKKQWFWRGALAKNQTVSKSTVIATRTERVVTQKNANALIVKI
jgi:hypothetical protein